MLRSRGYPHCARRLRVIGRAVDDDTHLYTLVDNMRLTQSSINQGLLRSEDTAAFALDKSMTVTETNILADSIERLVYSRGAMHEAYARV